MGIATDSLQLARRHLLDHGACLPSALNDRLARSWQRSLHAGLPPFGGRELAEPAGGLSLSQSLEQNAQMLSFARPVMDFMYGQIRGGDCMVVLADVDSMLLHTVGDHGFLTKAQRVELRTGASWHETVRGTNAIGTAIEDASALQVRAGEHYLERNGFLHCSAAPIWLKARYRDAVRVHLHSAAEGLDTPAEGIVVLSESGTLLGANQEAIRALRLAPHDFFALQLETRLQERLAQLLARTGREPYTVRLPDGRRMFLRVERPAQRTPSRAVVPEAHETRLDALAASDTGDAQWRRAAQQVRRILDKPIALLIQGESGVGKEVFARACHDSGPRRGRPFVAVNCAAIPESLIEAELFGYAPGAYTGAQKGGSLGRIREAEGGTLFLDEIGDMPLLLQTRLLRVLQEKKVTPLGGTPVPVDFALVSATHCVLADAVAEGRFRSDLYYRLNGFSVKLPALREREDFDALATRMLAQWDDSGVRIAPDLLAALRGYTWPGNLRQLASVLQTACALRDPAHEPAIDWPHLASDLRDALASPAARVQPAGKAAETRAISVGQADGAPEAAPPAALRKIARQAIAQALADGGGNVSEAARRLGISRQTIYRHLKKADAEA
jgi:transcriptional regulator of acetoin/glycerol metabolism